MGTAKKHNPVKLITGFIFNDEGACRRVKHELSRHFGAADYESTALPFAFTSYYEKEFGKNLFKSIISFRKLIPPEALVKIKTLTNRIEAKFSKNSLRLVNIDPGYLDMAKLVLASTKDFRHRIYLGKGIFAEITLYYQDGTFRWHDLTYPDYRTPEYIDIFNHIRGLYAKKLK